jgi:hypothetical protein
MVLVRGMAFDLGLGEIGGGVERIEIPDHEIDSKSKQLSQPISRIGGDD